MTYEEFEVVMDSFDPEENCCLEHVLGIDIPVEFYYRYDREHSNGNS